MIFSAYATLAVLSSTPSTARAHRHAERHAAHIRRLPTVDSSDLYSLRARRRFASYLRLRLLEMREANLERAAAVIERRLPLSSIAPAEARLPP